MGIYDDTNIKICLLFSKKSLGNNSQALELGLWESSRRAAFQLRQWYNKWRASMYILFTRTGTIYGRLKSNAWERSVSTYVIRVGWLDRWCGEGGVMFALESETPAIASQCSALALLTLLRFFSIGIYPSAAPSTLLLQPQLPF